MLEPPHSAAYPGLDRVFRDIFNDRKLGGRSPDGKRSTVYLVIYGVNDSLPVGPQWMAQQPCLLIESDATPEIYDWSVLADYNPVVVLPGEGAENLTARLLDTLLDQNVRPLLIGMDPERLPPGHRMAKGEGLTHSQTREDPMPAFVRAGLEVS